MEFFSGFKWAIPRAFSDAVALCRFEEGDILYDTKKVYEDNWDAARQFIEYSLQVKYPARVNSGGSEKAAGVFGRNWCSEVRVDLYKNLQKVGLGQIQTTQGRLYTALWKGDIAVLEKNSKEPDIPISAQDVTKILFQVTEKVSELSGGCPAFAMARDLSNPVSREKFSKILAALRGHLINQPDIINPEQAGITDFNNVAPTIDIAIFTTNGISSGELSEIIKNAIYAPLKNAKKKMFRISAHGIIV